MPGLFTLRCPGCFDPHPFLRGIVLTLQHGRSSAQRSSAPLVAGWVAGFISRRYLTTLFGLAVLDLRQGERSWAHARGLVKSVTACPHSPFPAQICHPTGLAPQSYALEGVGLPCETEPHVKNSVRIAPRFSHSGVENHAAAGDLRGTARESHEPDFAGGNDRAFRSKARRTDDRRGYPSGMQPNVTRPPLSQLCSDFHISYTYTCFYFFCYTQISTIRKNCILAISPLFNAMNPYKNRMSNG